jgi:FkbM family methyltransferase
MSYEPPEHKFEKHYQLKSGDTYIELGAWHGNYSQLAIDKIGPSGFAVLVEPSPVQFEILQNRMKKYKNVICVQKAIWKENGTIDFMGTGERYDHLKGVDFVVNDNRPLIKTETVTFDSLLRELFIDHIDLLTCDIEGGEKVLFQSTNFSKVQNMAVAIYHQPKDTPYLCTIALKAFGHVSVEDEGILYSWR